MKILFKKLRRVAKARSWRKLRKVIAVTFYDVESTRRELELVAKALVGETVLLYVRPPIVKNIAGQASRDSRGVRIIEIHPDTTRGLDYFYFTVLHECGHHVWNHVDGKRPAEVEKLYLTDGPVMELSEKEIREHDTDPDELQANSLRSEMDRLACNRALSRYGNDEITTRILVLKTFHIERKNENGRDHVTTFKC